MAINIINVALIMLICNYFECSKIVEMRMQTTPTIKLKIINVDAYMTINDAIKFFNGHRISLFH